MTLAEHCADLARLLPAAAALITEPDEDGTAGSSQPGTRPPWNSAAAAAVMDAHEGIRRLEASMRRDVTGRTGPKRGGSDANTMAALRAIEALAYGIPERHDEEFDEDGKRKPCRCPHCSAARILDRWARQIAELPAVDEAERPQKISAPCPYCKFPMLRVFPRSGRVTCLRMGACFDADGRHPVGTMEVGRLSPQVRWQDGLVAP